MKKIKKIKIRLNGKFKTVMSDDNIYDMLKNLNIPLKKVAIELNQEIIDKKKIKKKKFKDGDVVEIVHFIGGG